MYYICFVLQILGRLYSIFCFLQLLFIVIYNSMDMYLHLFFYSHTFYSALFFLMLQSAMWVFNVMLRHGAEITIHRGNRCAMIIFYFKQYAR